METRKPGVMAGRPPIAILGAVVLAATVEGAVAEMALMGRVTDQHGDPVAGAAIAFRGHSTPAWSASAVTDGGGRYDIQQDQLQATAVALSTWGRLKLGAAAKPAREAAQTKAGDFVAVAITHPEIAAYAADSLLVPEDRRFDFVVERVASADTSAGDAGDPGTPPADGGDQDDPPDDGGDPESPPEPEPGPLTLLRLDLDGQYIDALTVHGSTDRIAAGDTLAIQFVGEGLASVRQFDLVLEFAPTGLFDLARATWRAHAPFAAPGVGIPADGQVRVGGAILSFAGRGEGTMVLGELRVPTVAGPPGDATVTIERVLAGTSTSQREVFETLGVRIPVEVEGE